MTWSSSASRIRYIGKPLVVRRPTPAAVKNSSRFRVDRRYAATRGRPLRAVRTRPADLAGDRLRAARRTRLSAGAARGVARAGGGAAPAGGSTRRSSSGRSETILVQRRARAWIDLNRAEDERDPKVDTGARPGAPTTPKLRSGLGLVPARVSGAGALWRNRFAGAAIDDRIAADHRPYHARLALLLARARAAFGTAVLLDLHSMPTLGAGRPRVVLGDRFGTSAGGRFVARAEAAVAAAARMPAALNAPYAGGHVVHRHGDPRRGVHAIQLELDRTLYLDASLDGLGEGAAATAAIVRAVIDALADEALPSARMAAE
ncbi:MAG: hypothetical protein EOP68_02455 [Sphingomonas sp.]|nr:MAG: hypothetical protein EOP68_02455 [Sphingomonas sp.]